MKEPKIRFKGGITMQFDEHKLELSIMELFGIFEQLGQNML